MRNLLLSSLSLCFGLYAATATAAVQCSRDPAPAIPDGTTASLDEMQSAQQVMKAYMESSNAYMKCLDKQGASAGFIETHEARTSRLANYNAAVDEQTSVAGKFNAAVRAFKARN